MGEYTIYVLVDPRTDEVRYVGVTKWSLKTRLNCHYASSVHGRKGVLPKNHKACWVRSLDREGVRPAIRELEKTADRSREQEWIVCLRSLGANLTNSTNGGEGSGYNFTPDHVAKIVQAKKGMKYRKMDVATRKNMARNYVRTQEQRQKIAAALRGRKRPPEVVAKVLATKLAKRVEKEKLLPDECVERFDPPADEVAGWNVPNEVFGGTPGVDW